jgi:AcrR family transcriptional regulator
MKRANNDKKSTERKQPTQARSQKIVEAIVSAAQKILAEEGSRALNTNYVAEVADVNIASLYRWFPNKEAIIESAFEAMVNAEMDELLDFLKQRNNLTVQTHVMTIENMLSFIIDSLIMRQQRFLSLHESYYKENLDYFDLGERGVLDTNQTWSDLSENWLASIMQEHRPELTGEEANFRAFIAIRAIHGACLSTVSYRPELLSERRFRESLFTIALGLLEQ